MNYEQVRQDDEWFLKTVDETIKDIGSSKSGLSGHEAQKRLLEEGPNVIASKKEKSVLGRFLSEFNNLLIFILFVSSIISYASGHHIEFWVIILIIFITAFVGFIQQHKASKAIEALHRLTPKKVMVIRDSKKLQVDWEDIVDGDLVILERGMIIPADLRIIEAHDLKINESILTGESKLKYKHANRLDKENLVLSDMDNMAFCGTSVSSGSGKGIVVGRGLKSQLGIISLSIKSIVESKSPLQKKIDRLSKRISFYVVIAALLLFIQLTIRDVSFVESMLIVGAVLVSGIPESFPLALTLSLTSGVRKMAKQNAIIKDLSSVETLGTTTVICTDKTGTLTQNRMVVERFIIGLDKEFTSIGHGYEPNYIIKHKQKKVSKKALARDKHFFRGLLLCNNAESVFEEGDWKIIGEPTEGALLTLGKSAGFNQDSLNEYNPRRYEKAFDPAKKYMCVINRTGGIHTAYMKGAYEKVIKRCSHIRIGQNKKKLTKEHIRIISEQIENFSSQGLRCLTMASKSAKAPLGKNGRPADKDFFRKGFVYEGLVGIDDPLREDAADSVRLCQQAGIRVVMITGDHKKTAHSIGMQLSLIREGDLIVEGHEIDLMDDKELDTFIEKIAIFARTTPEHKLRIVSSLQRSGEIVAMTGDGVNDAPALKKADIGISMGRSGTDVAREASNMILTDDNFKSIALAVKEGRTIYSNIRRFIYYLLTGNFTEVLLILFAITLGLLAPLTAIMILFINLVTSTFPAMALGIEPTHEGVMRQNPRSPRERLLSNYVLLKILVIIPLLLFGSLSLFLWEMHFSDGNIDKARTLVFASLILFELFHVFNSRSLHGSIFNKNFFNNKYVFGAVGLSFIFMLLAIYSDVGQAIFSTVPLNGAEWLVLLFITSLIVFVTEMIKLLIRSEIAEQEKLGRLRIAFS